MWCTASELGLIPVWIYSLFILRWHLISYRTVGIENGTLSVTTTTLIQYLKNYNFKTITKLGPILALRSGQTHATLQRSIIGQFTFYGQYASFTRAVIGQLPLNGFLYSCISDKNKRLKTFNFFPRIFLQCNSNTIIYLKSLHREWLPILPSQGLTIKVLDTRKYKTNNDIEYRKFPKISPGAYIFQRPFWGAYIRRGLYSEGLIIGGKFVFQNRLGV